MSIPLSSHGNVFVHKGGKLEKRKFLAKMHQIASNCVSNFKIFPEMTPPDPHLWGGEHRVPLPKLLPRSALRASSATRWSPDSFILPLKTNGWIKLCTTKL